MVLGIAVRPERVVAQAANAANQAFALLAAFVHQVMHAPLAAFVHQMMHAPLAAGS